MTHKDYQLIATVLSVSKPADKLETRIAQNLWFKIRNKLIVVFEQDNSKFDRRIFIKDCDK